MSDKVWRSVSVLTALTFLIGTLSSTPTAARPGASVCSVALKGARKQKQEGKLLMARKRLLACTERKGCDRVTRRACVKLMEKLEAELPRVVFSLQNAQGGQVTEASVKVDGVVIAERLDGRAVRVDPGEHTFSFVTSEGEHDHRATIAVGAENQLVQATTATTGEKLDKGSLQATSSGSPLPWIVGGIGVAGVAGFLTLGLMRNSAEKSLTGCYPNCDRKQISRVSELGTMANFSLGIGVAGLVTSTVMFLAFDRPAASQRAALPADLRFALQVQGSGAFGGVQGAF